MVVGIHLALKDLPLLIALAHAGEPLRLVHDPVHQFLLRLWKIPVGLLALYIFEFQSQFQHQLLRIRVIADTFFHGSHYFQHRLPRFMYQFVTRDTFLFIEVEHLILEDVVGQRGLDLPDSILAQIRLTRFCRPRHHMHMGMLSLVMERGVPAEVVGRYLHRRGNVVAVRAEEVTPCRGVIETESGSILPLEGYDVGPDISGVVLYLIHSLVKHHTILITEQSVFTQTLCSRSSGDVLHVLV